MNSTIMPAQTEEISPVLTIFNKCTAKITIEKRGICTMSGRKKLTRKQKRILKRRLRRFCRKTLRLLVPACFMLAIFAGGYAMGKISDCEKRKTELCSYADISGSNPPAQTTKNNLSAEQQISAQEPANSGSPQADGYTYARNTSLPALNTTSSQSSTDFSDAVFVGNSLTEGFVLFSGIGNTTSFSHKGLTVKTIYTDKIVEQDNTKVTVMNALKNTVFQRVYLMFGLNELGWTYEDLFIAEYKKVIEDIKKINPDAVIYVQSILPICSRAAANSDYLSNKRIGVYNEKIKNMAAEENAVYLNVAEAVADENGVLPEDASVDGIHLKKEYCVKWLQYLQSH